MIYRGEQQIQQTGVFAERWVSLNKENDRKHTDIRQNEQQYLLTPLKPEQDIFRYFMKFSDKLRWLEYYCKAVN